MSWIMYVYYVVREYPDGTRGKRKKILCRYEPDLEVGGLYLHLGKSFPGMYRILDMKEETHQWD